MTENKRYPAILFISKIIRFFAWCSLILTIILFILLVQSGTADRYSFLATLGAGAFGGFLTLALFAIAEILIVMIDIEFNTRKSTESVIDENDISNAEKKNPNKIEPYATMVECKKCKTTSQLSNIKCWKCGGKLVEQITL